MHFWARVAAVSVLAMGAAVGACSSGAAKYPACERDEQCAIGSKHDYCVSGRCAYCRTSIDCGDRQRCRAGACEVDPDAPPMPEAGADSEADASEEAGDDDEAQESNRDEPEGRYQIRVRQLEQRVRQLRLRRGRSP